MSDYAPYPASAATTEAAAASPHAVRLDDLLASRGRRFAALLIDGVIVSVCFFVSLVVILRLTPLTGDSDQSNALRLLIMLLLWLAAALGYAPLLLKRDGDRNGQTLGKQLLKVRVVTQEGDPITYSRALRREFLGIWLINIVIGLYAVIDYAWAFFDDRRQALHDKIGSTYVVKADVPLELVHQLLVAPSAPSWAPSAPAHAPAARGAAQPHASAPAAAPAPAGNLWRPPGRPERPEARRSPHAAPESPTQAWQPPTPDAPSSAVPDRPSGPGERFDEARRAFGDNDRA